MITLAQTAVAFFEEAGTERDGSVVNDLSFPVGNQILVTAMGGMKRSVMRGSPDGGSSGELVIEKRDLNDLKDIDDLKDLKDLKDPKDLKDLKNPKDLKDLKDTDDLKD